MKGVLPVLVLWSVSALGTLAHGESMPADASSIQQSRDAERSRINAERSRLEAIFMKESAACHQTFFVNNCLDEAKVRQRALFADLRRQEVSLNEEERKIKGAEQVQRTDDKVRPEKLREENEKRTEAIKNFESRVQRDKEKVTQRLNPNSARSNQETATARIKSNEDKAAAKLNRQVLSSDEVKIFEERQARAKERQIKHQQEQQNRTKPLSNPLPVPP